MDWNESYKRFLKQKSYAFKKKGSGLTCHHIFPKCKGGKRDGNIAVLTPIDHLVAHMLLAISDKQLHRQLISYSPSIQYESVADNILKRWPPLLKLKVKFTDANGECKVATLTWIAKDECDYHGFKHEQYKNKFICRAFFNLMYGRKVFRCRDAKLVA